MYSKRTKKSELFFVVPSDFSDLFNENDSITLAKLSNAFINKNKNTFYFLSENPRSFVLRSIYLALNRDFSRTCETKLESFSILDDTRNVLRKELENLRNDMSNSKNQMKQSYEKFHAKKEDVHMDKKEADFDFYLEFYCQTESKEIEEFEDGVINESDLKKILTKAEFHIYKRIIHDEITLAEIAKELKIRLEYLLKIKDMINNKIIAYNY